MPAQDVRVITGDPFATERLSVHQKTESLVNDESIPVLDRLKALEALADRRCTFETEATLSDILRAAQQERAVAAIVEHGHPVFTKAVFLGYLNPEKTVGLDTSGITINTLHGQLVPVIVAETLNGMEVLQRGYHADESPMEPTTFDGGVLRIASHNFAPSASFTALAADIIRRTARTDTKIAYAGIDLPRLMRGGTIEKIEDKLNLVEGLGKTTLKAMWKGITQPIMVTGSVES